MKKFLALAIAALLLLTNCTTFGKPDNTSTGEPEAFNDISAVELVEQITIGWNLGNTLDTTDLHWMTNPSLAQMEIAWGNPVTKKKNIDTLKEAGFNTIRIPVSWAKCVSVKNDYKIRADWMARVKKVVDFAVSNDMIIILNTHHDEGIFKFHDSEMEESKKAFVKVWEQIAEAFKNYNEKLIFEGLNEPRTKDSPAEWTGGTEEERKNLNTLHQLFVDTVRASGGNNERRILLISTYGASATEVAMNDLVLPTDTAKDKLVVSIHAYEPYDFALNESSAVNTWSASNPADTFPLTGWIDRAHDLFISQGIPVILGEFGALNKSNEAARAAWAEYYVSYAKSRDIRCVWWDNGGNLRLLSRSNNTFPHPQILDALMRASR